ncbi:hypothetical protein ACNTMW_01220 [Planosporangium sp. 12N6]|uniref:hypothetical protein n=1 Tax=Planosporangium spinosum TaxID=3402278 RepID=UPI003CEB79C0
MRSSAVGIGLTAILTAGLGTVLTTPASASPPQPLGLSCREQVLSKIGVGPVLFGVQCSGNSSSPYWAEGYCKIAGAQRGPTQFPPFILPGYGPWSNVSCPSGDYLISYRAVHG